MPTWGETDASFRALAERLPDAVLVHRAGEVLYANAAASRLFGYGAPEEMIGQPTSMILGGDPALVIEPSPWIEQRIPRRDGSVADVEMSGTSLGSDGDGGPAILLSFRDLSERRARTAKMMQIDRTISVGTLAAGVGHEINNPLAYVMTNLEWLADHLRAMRPSGGGAGLAEDDEVYAVIDECQLGARRIRDIVRSLQTFACADETPTRPVDLRPLIESAISMAANEVRNRTKVRCEHSAVPLVEASESRLGQVLLNLVLNAARAIADGRRSENEILVRTWHDQLHVMVSVSDTGPGIPPEALPRIFDPFFTTRPVGEGTGLGLALCRDIVNGLGGEISAHSVPGEGATFLVRLPRARGTDVPELPRSRPGSRAARRSRVLVVDDEPRLCAVFERMLGDEHDLVLSSDGRDARELLDSGAEFDVVFLDLMMPDVSGMDLYAHIEATRPALLPRIVVMTGGAYTQEARALVERLPSPPLTKPLDFDDVRERIATLST